MAERAVGLQCNLRQRKEITGITPLLLLENRKEQEKGSGGRGGKLSRKNLDHPEESRTYRKLT